MSLVDWEIVINVYKCRRSEIIQRNGWLINRLYDCHAIGCRALQFFIVITIIYYYRKANIVHHCTLTKTSETTNNKNNHHADEHT